MVRRVLLVACLAAGTAAVPASLMPKGVADALSALGVTAGPSAGKHKRASLNAASAPQEMAMPGAYAIPAGYPMAATPGMAADPAALAAAELVEQRGGSQPPRRF